MEYLAAAYGVIWLVVFVFIFSIYRRQKAVEQELEMLEEIVRDRDSQ